MLCTLPREDDGVLIPQGDRCAVCDDTGFGKQGQHSVSIAHQYSGTRGKVNCHYAERTLAWPVASRLDLPQSWCDDSQRRAVAQVPEVVTFQTKVELTLDLLDQACAWQVRHACVVADADYGDNPDF